MTLETLLLRILLGCIRDDLEDACDDEYLWRVYVAEYVWKRERRFGGIAAEPFAILMKAKYVLHIRQCSSCNARA